jgi:hypothetical protein
MLLSPDDSLLSDGNPIDFWNWVAFIKTPSGVLKFNSVLHAIRFIFGLPCSNVVVERLFSILKTVKMKREMGSKT